MQVLYADNHLLVVYKPGGIPVQADASGDEDLLTQGKAWIKREKQKPGDVFLGLVHRLDRPARGVVVLGRTSKAAARLSAQFRDHTIEKIYRVAVHGKPRLSSGTLHDWLDSDERGSRIVAPGRGKESILDYRVVQTDGARSLLEINLQTGRKHQIRCQLAALGHPVLGDLRYGAPSPLPDKCIALLAWRLTLTHPTTQERLTFLAPDVAGWPFDPRG